NVDVRQGTLEINGGSTLGDATKTATVYSGAALQFFGGVGFAKQLVVNSDAVNPALINANGDNSLGVGSAVTLNGNCIASGGGTRLTLSCPVGGGGGLTKVGSSTLVLGGSGGDSISYSGATVVSGGTLLVNGTKTGGAGIVVGASTIIGGNGSIAEAVAVT